MELTWTQGIVTANYHWTDKLYSLRIHASMAPFTAGQFTKLGLDIDDVRVAKPYSLVNSPAESWLEFYSISIPGGSLSDRLMQLQPGDKLWVQQQAAGFLTLKETQPGKHLWLLATGTGIGPFLSILKTAEPWQKFEKIILVHAVRYADELIYQDLIQSWQQSRGTALCHVPFISREVRDFAMKGRIPQAIADHSLERHVGVPFNPQDSQVMLCGNPAMLADTIKVLTEQKGLKRNRRRDPGNIMTENYW